MISTNNKIRNENPASTGSLAASKRVFSTFHLSRTRTNQRTCCINLDMSRLMQQASRPGFRQKKVESVSKACRKPARTCLKPGCKPGRKTGLQPGLQLARIMECGLYATDLSLRAIKCCSVVFGVMLKLLVINISSSFPAINNHRRLLPAYYQRSVTTYGSLVRPRRIDTTPGR